MSETDSQPTWRRFSMDNPIMWLIGSVILLLIVWFFGLNTPEEPKITPPTATSTPIIQSHKLGAFSTAFPSKTFDSTYNREKYLETIKGLSVTDTGYIIDINSTNIFIGTSTESPTSRLLACTPKDDTIFRTALALGIGSKVTFSGKMGVFIRPFINECVVSPI